MKVKKILLLLAVTLLGITNTSAFAEAGVCENFDAEPAHFKSLYEAGKELGRAICFEYGKVIGSPELAKKFSDFATEADQQVATEFAGKSFLGDLLVQMGHFSELARLGVNKGQLPTFNVDNGPGLHATTTIFNFANFGEIGSADSANPECQQDGKPTCRELLDALEIALDQYRKPYAQLSAGKVTEQWQQLAAEWDRYFEESRSQTLLDAFLTTYMAQDHLAQSRLVGPMSQQWFVIHPSIVIENVSAALDGDEVAEALAIEWLGFNWWDKKTSPIGYPFGISVTSTFSDRASVEDAGHGVMFHFNNTMSIGWTDHDGDKGIFVTVDFLNLAAQKKKRWEDYKEEIDDIVDDKLKQLKTAGQL